MRHIILGFCGLVACVRTPTTVAIIAPPDAVSEAIRAVPIYAVDTFTTRRRMVIRDRAAWAKVLSTMPRGMLPPPAVDFATEIVILAGTRSFSGTGPSIEIDSVRLHGRELTAYVRTGSCAGPSFGGHLMTTPVHAVAVPRRYTKVRFVESHKVSSGCFSERPDTTA